MLKKYANKSLTQRESKQSSPEINSFKALINKKTAFFFMLLTYKFRIYPSKQQQEKLLFVLDKCRFTYNKLLEILNKQEKINQSEIQAEIPKLKEQYPDLNEIYSKTLQYESYRLFSNLRALSRLKKNGKKIGCLRFKGKDWFKTFTYNQSGFVLEIKNKKYNKLHLSKIGSIPIRTHRVINGSIKQVQIKKECSGKWFALLCVHMNEPKQREKTKKSIGIDLGTINFIYDSDGNHADHPKFLNKSLKKLAAEQRKLSRKKKGSNNRTKQKINVAKIHEAICNQRNDFLHKISRYYVNNYDFIAAEDLDIRNIIKESYSARNIMDASWSNFLQMLGYKAESAGISFVKVNPRDTTSKCYRCETIVKKPLYERIHKCSCGPEIDRDYNAALNILKSGQELAFMPLEAAIKLPMN